jgi:hypothetical protein
MDGMAEPLRLLTAHAYIRERPVDHQGPGRKPSTTYEVNPFFYAHHAHNAQNTLLDPDSAHCAHSAQGIGA